MVGKELSIIHDHLGPKSVGGKTLAIKINMILLIIIIRIKCRAESQSVVIRNDFIS